MHGLPALQHNQKERLAYQKEIIASSRPGETQNVSLRIATPPRQHCFKNRYPRYLDTFTERQSGASMHGCTMR